MSVLPATADINVNQIVPPTTLRYIEKFVFSGTVVRKGIRFPEKMEFIDDYALADCAFGSLRLPDGFVPSGMKKKRISVNESEKALYLQRVPEFAGKYYLGTKKIRGGDELRYLEIKERKPVFHKDCRIIAIWDNNFIDVGLSVIHKIQRGNAFVCIRHKDEKILSVKILCMKKIYSKEGRKAIVCVY